MDQNQNSTNQGQPEEGTEMTQLDMIISKVEEMVKNKTVDPEEILMDLQDYKASMGNEQDSMDNSIPSGMADMIDKASMGGGK